MTTLAVKITADIADLQAKYAVATQAARAYSAELQKLSKAAAAGTIDAAGQESLRKAAQGMLEAKQSAAGYAESLTKAGINLKSFGAAANESSFHVASTARHVKMLTTELAEGKFASAGVSLLRLASHFAFLTGPIGLAIAAIVAITAALGYLVAKAIMAGNALDRVKIGADVAGNFDITREAVEKFANQLAHSADISQKDAIKITQAMAAVPGVTEQSLRTAEKVVADYVQATGADANKASEYMKKLLNPEVSASKWLEEQKGITQLRAEWIHAAEDADKLGSESASMAAKLRIADAIMQQGGKSVDGHNASMRSSVSIFMTYVGAMMAGMSKEEIQNELIAQETKEREKNKAAIEAETAALKAQQATPEHKMMAGIQLAQKENPQVMQIREAQGALAQFKADIAGTQQVLDSLKLKGGSKEEIEHTTRDLNDMKAAAAETAVRLGNMQFGPVMERMREEIRAMQASWDGSQEEMLAKTLQIQQKYLTAVRGSKAQTLQVQKEIDTTLIAQRTEAGNMQIEQVRETNAEIAAQTRLSEALKLSEQRANLQQELAAFRGNAQQRIQIEKEVARMTSAIRHAQNAEADAIEQSNTQTTIALARAAFNEKKAVLDEELAAHQITAAQKAAIESAALEQMHQMEKTALQMRLLDYALEPAKVAEINNEILRLDADFAAQKAQIDKQLATESRKAAEEQAKAWKKGVDEIEGAESTMLGDLLAKRKSFKQAALQAAGQLADQEIINTAKALTTRLLLQNTYEAKKKASEQGGFIYNWIFGSEDVTKTAANEATKTAAVTTGAEARQTATTAAAAQGAATQSAIQSKSIMADAGKAFSGVYASVASIPYVGWILAPVAASAAFAAVAAYEGLTSLDVGAWDIPRDMPAKLHAGETVLPKDFAAGFRSAIGGAGQSAAAQGGTYGDTNITNHFHNVMPGPDIIMAHIQKAFRNAHPATRGRS